MLVFMAGAYAPLIYVAPMAAHLAGFGVELLPLVLLCNGVGAFAGTNLGGQLADRLGARRTVRILSVAQVLVLASYAAIPLLPSAFGPTSFLMVMTLAGFVGWAFWAAQSSLLGAVAGPAVPLALALNLTALNLGLSLAAVVGGAIVDTVGAGALAVASMPLALLALGLASLPRRVPA